MIFLYFLSSTISYFWRVEYRKKVFRACAGGSGAKMVTQNTYPNLSNIVHTDFELGWAIQTVIAADPGITKQCTSLCMSWHAPPPIDVAGDICNTTNRHSPPTHRCRQSDVIYHETLPYA